MKGLHLWILAALVLGLGGGLAANALSAPGWPLEGARPALDGAVREVLGPLGKVFLRLLFLSVLPLVFSSLALGVRELGDFRRLGRVGLKTLLFTLALSAGSTLIGVGLVNAIRPGERLDAASREALLEDTEGRETLRRGTEPASRVPVLDRVITTLIPRNPVEAAARAFDGDMLGVLFFAFLFGTALAQVKPERASTLVSFLEGLLATSKVLVDFAMKLAPLGVAALVFSAAARLGIGIVWALGLYVLTVLLGLAIHQGIVYSVCLRVLCGIRASEFFRRIWPVMVTAFSTSSSNATLPATLETGERALGIAPRVGNFVLTLGSTFNQNGTALFEGVTVLFLAQVHGIELRFEEQLLVVAMSILAGIGTAGVPGGSIPLIVPVLVSIGIPAEGIVIILGVDRLLDMCRTVLNVTGDLVAATWVARSEGELAWPESPSLGDPEREGRLKGG